MNEQLEQLRKRVNRLEEFIKIPGTPEMIIVTELNLIRKSCDDIERLMQEKA